MVICTPKMGRGFRCRGRGTERDGRANFGVPRSGVGLNVAGEAGEHFADGGAGVLDLVFEDDAVAIGEHDEEVALCFLESR
jgi:hypothetical protein